MPEIPRRPIGRVVRDPAFSEIVVGRENREGELEIVGERLDEWSTGDNTIVPSRTKAAEIQGALKEALRSQLEAESATLGEIGNVALHAKTGISL
jgi:hypothetical protein